MTEKLTQQTEHKTEIFLQNYSLHFGPQTEENIPTHSCNETKIKMVYTVIMQAAETTQK